MSLLDRFRRTRRQAPSRREFRNQRGQRFDPNRGTIRFGPGTDELQAVWPGGGIVAPDGTPLSADEAMRISAVGACLRFLAGTLAPLPLRVNDADGYEDEAAPELRLFDTEVSPLWSVDAFMRWIIEAWGYLGYSRAWIERTRNGEVLGLHPSIRSGVTLSNDGRRRVYLLSLPGSRAPIAADQDDVLDFQFDGTVAPGRSLLTEAAGKAIATIYALDRFGTNYFGKGSFFDTVLSVKPKTFEGGELPADDAELDRIGERFEAYHGRGVEHEQQPLVLSGVEVSRLINTLNESQFTDVRLQAFNEVCSAMGVQPILVGVSPPVRGAITPDAALTLYRKTTLRSIFSAITAELSRKLGAPFAFNEWTLARGDLSELATALQTLLGEPGKPGVISQNEARRRLGEKPSDDPRADELNYGDQQPRDPGGAPAAQEPPEPPAEPAEGDRGNRRCLMHCRRFSRPRPTTTRRLRRSIDTPSS